MKVVLGAGFGDEGKGRVVDALCARSQALPGVIRFSGGHQAAHRVVVGDQEHIFAHFGSGTLRGAPTYWTANCPVAPTHLMNELVALESLGVEPTLYIDGKCAVTTPYDIWWGRSHAVIMREHGSCGMGIYATYKRELDGYHLLFEDLLYPEIVRIKLEQIRAYYRGVLPEEEEERFIEDCKIVAEHVRDKIFHLAYGIHDFEIIPRKPFTSQNYIFEGSQGMMLDMDYGFFPHVTPSNTGTQNVMGMIGSPVLDTWLVTRSYATRHGLGPFVPFEGGEYEIKNPEEKNEDDGRQGKFRSGPLSLDFLEYVVNKDMYLQECGVSNVVVTCMDLLEGKRYLLIKDGKLLECRGKQDFLERIRAATRADTLWISDSANGNVPLKREM